MERLHSVPDSIFLLDCTIQRHWKMNKKEPYPISINNHSNYIWTCKYTFTQKLWTNLLSVHRLVRSNMNKIATASLQAIGTWSSELLSPTTSDLRHTKKKLYIYIPPNCLIREHFCIYMHIPPTSQMLKEMRAPWTINVLSIKFTPVISKHVCSSCSSPTYLIFKNKKHN